MLYSYKLQKLSTTVCKWYLNVAENIEIQLKIMTSAQFETI